MPKFLALVIISLAVATGILLKPFKTREPEQPSVMPNAGKFILGPNKNKFPIDETEIIFVGDIMLGRSVMTTSLLKVKNPAYPFEKVADKLKSADLAVGNLENPIIDGCPFSDSGFKFCASPEMVGGLVAAGVDVVSLANNHTKNYGLEGFNQTKKYLHGAGLSFTGDGNLVVKEIRGIKYGLLGFDFVGAGVKDADLEVVGQSDKKVDVLIILVHWGSEYVSSPSEIQKQTAGKLVNSGADIIIGAHPHWVQTEEVVKGKHVFYSLGNFVFDQPWSEETKKGMAVKIFFDSKGQVSNIEKMPIYMGSFSQPEWVE